MYVDTTHVGSYYLNADPFEGVIPLQVRVYVVSPCCTAHIIM